MPKKLYPTNVVQLAKTILGAWNQINPALAFGNLNVTAMTTEITQATSLATKILSLEAQLIDLRNQRDAVYVSLWDKVKRVRSGVKGVYGDDSSQYEIIGGTRMSDKKAPRRKVVTE